MSLLYTRRRFLAFTGAGLAFLGTGLWSKSLRCSFADIRQLVTMLPPSLCEKARALRMILKNTPASDAHAIDKLSSIYSCTAQDLLSSVQDAMREDQKADRLIIASNWVLPETAVILAQDVIRSGK
jgi:hypothetical protein